MLRHNAGSVHLKQISITSSICIGISKTSVLGTHYYGSAFEEKQLSWQMSRRNNNTEQKSAFRTTKHRQQHQTMCMLRLKELPDTHSVLAVRLLCSELLNHFNTWYILQELDLVVKMWPLKEQARCKSVFTFYKSQIAQLWNAFFPPRWLKLFRQTRYNLKTSCCGTDWDTILWKTSIILAP